MQNLGSTIYIFMQPITHLLIDNTPHPPASFAVPEMSLSSSRATMIAHIFSFKINTAYLIEYLEPAYLAWVAESKEDNEQHGEPQDDLARAGYPSLAELLKNPALSELVVGHYLLQESLGKLAWDGISPIQYWLDKVVLCEIEAEFITLSGICYSKPANQGN
ncbi:hypothetical protein [Massilia sp. NR 4-1]|uniref:hypothetical protein n=1 Tax=Massilia sp. NR 4-1 TaxID=1678028 RepID=UPI00067E56A8|nr:hypothetical protein [Massilia sp. NR 4-1]AKU20585.1 hypothetical protein ACZ75_02685 [Massilia sp. NR 4-1]